MPIAEVPGAVLTFDTAGDRSRPAVLFVHAGVATRAMWHPQFADLGADHFVVRYDTRGFGESRGDGTPFADRHDLIAVLDAAGVERATLVGASRGGRIALDATLESPERVSGLVTVGSTPGGQPEAEPTPAERALVERMIAADADGDVEELLRLDTRYWAVGPTREPAEVDPVFTATAAELNRDAEHRDFAGRAVALDPPALGRLGEVSVPALVVIGDHDDTDSRAGYDLLVAGLRRAEGARFPDSAHLPSVEHPQRFTALVRAFLAANRL